MKKLLFILCFIGIWYLTCNATQSYLVSNIVQTEEQTPVATEENSPTEESAEPATEESSEPAVEETSETSTEETPAEESSQDERKTSSSPSVSSKGSSSSDDGSSNNDNSEKKSEDVEDIDAAIRGFLILIVLIVCLRIYFKRRKRRKHEREIKLCPKCGELTMVIDDIEPIKDQQVKVRVKDGYDSKNNRTIFGTDYATKKTLKVHRHCTNPNCDYQESYITERIEKNEY